MGIPAVSRAYWSKTFHCVSCKKPRPTFLSAILFERKVGFGRCIMCQREKNRKKVALSRSLETSFRTSIRNKKDAARHKITPLTRARNRRQKLRAERIWGTIDEILPIYEKAYELELENPGYEYRVEHIYPLNGKNVCGLHTIKNLRIRKRKLRSSPSDQT